MTLPEPRDQERIQLEERLRTMAADPAISEGARDFAAACLRSAPSEAGPLSLVFLGEVGAGKTSLLCRLAGLLLEAQPASSEALNESAVLPTGVGRISLCEVVVEAGPLAVKAEPMLRERLEEELRIWAEDLHQIAFPIEGATTALPSSRELDKALRGLLRNRTLRRPTPAERAAGLSGMVDPALVEARQQPDREAFVASILSEARLEHRYARGPAWRYLPDLADLRRRVRALHQGEQADEPVPDRIDLRFPGEGPLWALAGEIGRPLRLIDTRGLDGDPADRQDLAPHLSDPNAVLLLCCPFKSAPGAYARPLCALLSQTTQGAEADERMALIVVDTGESALVAGAEGDRSFGQDLKQDEVLRALRAETVTAGLGPDRLVVVDALRDGPEKAIALIAGRVRAVESARRQAVAEWCDRAREVLEYGSEDRVEQARQNLDQHLFDAFPKGAPLLDPLSLMAEAVQNAGSAQTVMACVRRRGRWRNLNLFQRLLRGAHRAALEWASPLKAVLQSERGRIAAELQAEGGPAVVLWLDRQKDLLRFAADYAQRVHDDVADVLEADRVFWQLCKSIRGAGQVERVAQLLLDWGRANGHRLHAHLKVSPQMMFPGWRPGAMERPSPPFLSVQRLRRLRSARWAIPRDLSLLIGPNGSGKTTLLRCLTFLHLALERSPGEAIQIAFGGAQNLRSRGAPDAEPVLIELALAEARWVWSIWPSGGGFNWTEEIFTGEQRCFHRDLSGAEVADGVRWRSTGRSGLWSLSYAGRAGPALEALARVVAGIRVHGDLDIEHLREVGADSALGAGELDRRGHQALALLQRWMDDPREEERHHFVVEGLKSAFPQDLSRFGRADGAGRYIQFQVFAPGAAQPTPLSDQASGFLQALLVLTALAAAEPGGIVLIDDPESCLHPFAERCLMAFARDWAAQRQLSIVLVTHSGVMLNGLTEAPERVFLAVPHPSTETIPCALTALFDEDWLHRFTLGERQADNSFGTNQAPP